MVAIPASAGGGGQASGGPGAGAPAPMGSVPASQATPNAGMEAQGIAALRVWVNMGAHILAMIGPHTEAGNAMTSCIGKMAKFVPPGAVSPAAETNQLDNMQRRQMQAGPQVAALRAGPGASPSPAAAA